MCQSLERVRPIQVEVVDSFLGVVVVEVVHHLVVRNLVEGSVSYWS